MPKQLLHHQISIWLPSNRNYYLSALMTCGNGFSCFVLAREFIEEQFCEDQVTLVRNEILEQSALL